MTADMRSHLLAVSAVMLFLSSAHAQAPAMQPAPIVEPAPAFPAPSLTPAGAGASHGMLPAPQAEVPRSPNKRVLPASSEPGLWAADGAPRAATPLRLFDVEIPYPGTATHPDAIAETEGCVATLARASDARARARLATMPLEQRSCLAAQALLHCAAEEVKKRKAMEADKQPIGPLAGHNAERLWRHALGLVAARCRDSGVLTTDAMREVLASVAAQWDKTQKDYL
jgi:hypothetical protein